MDIVNAVIAAISPHIPEIATLLAFIVTTVFLVLLRTAAQALSHWGASLGVQADAVRSEALTRAFERAARLALDRKLTGDAALNFMIAYAREALPDAIAALDPSGAALRNRAAAELSNNNTSKNRM